MSMANLLSKKSDTLERSVIRYVRSDGPKRAFNWANGISRT